MKLRPIVLAATSALLMGWILLGKKQSAQRKRRQEEQDKALDAPTGVAFRGDADALSALSAINAHEIASAELIQGKDVSEPVQRYARMLHAQHSDSQRQLQELARSERLALSELNPNVVQLNSRSRRDRDALDALQGDELEIAYLDSLIKSHQSALELIDNDLLPASARADVDGHLQDTRGHLATHLDRARALRESLVPHSA